MRIRAKNRESHAILVPTINTAIDRVDHIALFPKFSRTTAAYTPFSNTDCEFFVSRSVHRLLWRVQAGQELIIHSPVAYLPIPSRLNDQERPITVTGEPKLFHPILHILKSVQSTVQTVLLSGICWGYRILSPW
jgi:hypothetical protein